MLKRIISILSTGLLIFIVWVTIDWYTQKSGDHYTEKEMEAMVQKCMESSKYLLSNNKEKAHEICSCAIDELTRTYAKDEVAELNQLGPDAYQVFLIPHIESCRTPVPVTETPFQEQMNQCLEAFGPRVGQENAIVFCDCFVPYLVEKYGYDQLHKKDSIIALEVEKITDCADFLQDAKQ
ncbi:MAG: hypothetical protein GVY19_02520 [Bacteroidetes bacterium]|jgi:hypothetical protein|nr:hypothetical protein [Bacteroidota bacterium]